MALNEMQGFASPQQIFLLEFMSLSIITSSYLKLTWTTLVYFQHLDLSVFSTSGL